MVTLLCFGDSNTWGYNPATWERYPQDIRWPGVLQNELGESYRVIEDGQNGRTAIEGKAFAGFNTSKADLVSTLANHSPLNLVILMLGTNDLLMRSSVSPDDVGKRATEALVELEAVGVARFTHNRGAIVKPFGPQQLRDIFHLRRILETEAARCACGRLQRETLESLRSGMRELADDGGSRQWSEEEMGTDRHFHELIAAGCGNARIPGVG